MKIELLKNHLDNVNTKLTSINREINATLSLCTPYNESRLEKRKLKHYFVARKFYKNCRNILIDELQKKASS